ncbi:hypothetical protein CLAUR_022890 [Clostridium felsineum]|nr:hypothetical protein CLAUR_022890 [Clostridium felsineum]
MCVVFLVRDNGGIIMENTLRFEMVTGINKGYFNNNQQDFMFDFISELWQDIAKREFEFSRIYVSAVINKSKSVYNEELGCPKGGEYTFVITGVANSEFINDIIEWKNAVIRIAKTLKRELKQSTLSCEFLNTELYYFN